MEEILDISGEILEIGDYVSLYKNSMMIGTVSRFSKRGSHVFIDLIWFSEEKRHKGPGIDYSPNHYVGEELQTIGKNVFKLEFDMKDRLLMLKLSAS